MTVEIRDANENDEQRCAELLAELTAATGTKHDINMGDTFRQLLTQERGRIIVAEENSTLLGLATASYNLAIRYGGEYCQLEELILTPESRGKKLGGRLLQQVIDNATARGCSEIGLYLMESTEHNRAFYGKYGFEVIGTEMRQRLNT